MHRPDLRPRIRIRALLLGALALGGVATAAIVSASRPAPAPTVVTMAPAAVTVPAPVVTVMPPPPPPAPPPPAPAPPPPPLRALAPSIAADCLLPIWSTDSGPQEPTYPEACGRWPDGFPAVSPDGARIAFLDRGAVAMENDPDRGATLTIEDSKTMHVLRRIELSTPAEFHENRDVALERVERRAEAAQRVLDAGRYEPLISLGDTHEPGDPTGIHLEFEGEHVRIVDPATSTILWQATPTMDAPPGQREDPDGNRECTSWNHNRTEILWNPHAKIVVAQLLYFTGGCMCPDTGDTLTYRLP
ncbi:MAG TPA: hypothetical protein VGM88_33775 [Kofleriaceae bacterium]|jgi:hypothetical protein